MIALILSIIEGMLHEAVSYWVRCALSKWGSDYRPFPFSMPLFALVVAGRATWLAIAATALDADAIAPT